MPSLILTNVHTKEGPKTFTMRWKKENNKLISWTLIYAFIFKKTGIEKNGLGFLNSGGVKSSRNIENNTEFLDIKTQIAHVFKHCS